MWEHEVSKRWKHVLTGLTIEPRWHRNVSSRSSKESECTILQISEEVRVQRLLLELILSTITWINHIHIPANVLGYYFSHISVTPCHQPTAHTGTSTVLSNYVNRMLLIPPWYYCFKHSGQSSVSRLQSNSMGGVHSIGQGPNGHILRCMRNNLIKC